LLLGPNNAHELRRAFTLALHEARELRLRHPHRLPSVLRDPVAQIRPGEYAPDVLRKLINHCGRSAGRDPYSTPNREVESGTLRSPAYLQTWMTIMLRRISRPQAI
jgi:hypothetical protein